MTAPNSPLDYNAATSAQRRAAALKTLRRWILRITLILFLLAILVMAIDQIWVWQDRRITIGPDTTRILSPIEPNGRPDYLAAINTHCSAGITKENNAAPLLLEIVGTDEWSEKFRSPIQKLLDLNPTPFPRQYITLAESNQTLRGSTTKPSLAEESAALDEEKAAASTPWNPADHPQWAAWVNANAHALDLLQSATEKPRYYVPIVTHSGSASSLADTGTLVDIFLPSLGRYRQLANVALARAMMNLQTKNIPAFQSDLLAAAKLARLLTQGSTLIEYLVACALDNSVSTALQAAATSDLLTADQLRNLHEQILALAPLPPPTDQIDSSERYLCLDFICKCARVNDETTNNFGTFRPIPVNFDHCLRIANASYDSIVAAFRLPTHAERRKALTAFDTSFAARYATFGRIERAILDIIPDLTGVDKILTNDQANRNLALTALALRAYKLKTGNFPPTLPALPPSALPNTTDPWTDLPLIYRPEAQGYILYSLGPDQHDDAGTPRTPDGPASRNYDIVVRAAQ